MLTTDHARRTLGAAGLALGLAVTAGPVPAQELKEVNFSEAVHNLGYINLYVGMHAGIEIAPKRAHSRYKGASGIAPGRTPATRVRDQRGKADMLTTDHARRTLGAEIGRAHV